jgi:ketosteroid isomerase-like protein
MDDMTAVRRAVDRLLGGDLGPMLDLLAEDVEFEVEEGGDSPARRMGWGRQAVADHFAALGELVAFWQIDYGAVDGQVIAWGKESFTVEGCGLEGECEFAFVFDLDGGRIARFLVVEDLARQVMRRVSPPPVDRARVSVLPRSQWRVPSLLRARQRAHRG